MSEKWNVTLTTPEGEISHNTISCDGMQISSGHLVFLQIPAVQAQPQPRPIRVIAPGAWLDAQLQVREVVQ